MLRLLPGSDARWSPRSGRPDDGTDTTGFFNTEYFVDLKPKEQWRPVFHQNKEELIAAMDRELEKIPGVLWNFSQPIADNMEEAVSGVKGELAVKLYGDDLRTLEAKGDQIVNVMRKIRGVAGSGTVPRRRTAQSESSRWIATAAARYGINVADVQDAIQTAVGGNAVGQVLQGEQRYDLVVRYLPQYRDTKDAIERHSPALARPGERVSLAQLCQVKIAGRRVGNLPRSATPRYVAIKYSVRGRDLGSTVEEAIAKVDKQVKLAARLSHRLGGRIREPEAIATAAGDRPAASRSSLILHDPLHHVQFRQMGAADPVSTWPWRRSAACWRCCSRTPTSACPRESDSSRCSASRCRPASSCSSTSISCARAATRSKMRRSKARCCGSAPIMMTMLVATLGLLPAAMSHGIGSDSQRPFAIVIVGGLMAALLMSIFLLPTLYVWIAGERDVLPAPEREFEN